MRTAKLIAAALSAMGVATSFAGAAQISSSPQKPRVVLITSLDTAVENVMPKVPAEALAHPEKLTRKQRTMIKALQFMEPMYTTGSSLKDYLDTYIGNLEAIFRRKFEQSGWDVDVQVVRNANAAQVHQVLMSGRNVAVFFIGHANTTPNAAGGVNTIVADRDLNNIQWAFHAIHPNLRFIAMIGCKNQEAANQIVGKRPGLEVFSLSDKTEARLSLPKAIEASLNRLKTMPSVPEPCEARREVEQGFRVRITRTIPTDAELEREAAGRNEKKKVPGAVSIYLAQNRELIAVFPAGNPGETQERIAWFKAPGSLDALSLKIKAESGSEPLVSRAPIAIGDLRIEWDPGVVAGGWSPFTNRQGMVEGVSYHIYRYDQGPAPDASLARSFYPYSCVTLAKPQQRASSADPVLGEDLSSSKSDLF